jgi:hypothetical protein
MRTGVWVLMAVLPLAAGAVGCAGQTMSLMARGGMDIGTSATDQHGQIFTVAGLSGIAWLGGTSYVAVMDNSNRLVFLTVTLAGNGAVTGAAITGGLTLSESRDFEDIAVDGETVLLAEEGTPQVRRYSLTDGASMGTLPVPAVFLSRRDNFGFESLSRRGETGEVWTANEEALTVDGPVSTASVGTVVRLLRYAPGDGGLEPREQYAYQTQPLHGFAISGSRSGVSQVLVLPGGRVLVLERSLALGATTFQSRLYEVDFIGATDVSGLPAANAAGIVRVAKTQLYSGSQNNLEGLTLGPRLSQSSWAMVGIVDDGDPISVNRVVTFVLQGPVVACTNDFNNDGDFGTDQDIEAFFACLAGNCCGLCGTADFNGDGDTGTDQDIEAFFRVLSGSPC